MKKLRISRVVVGIVFAELFAGSGGISPMHAAETLHKLTVTERFGVSHPDQVIDFDLPTGLPGSNVYVIETATGHVVPFQFLERGGKLAVRTDLPAGATKSWTLLRGKAPSARTTVPTDAGLTVTEREDGYEIVNGLTGVRVPKAVVAPGPKRLPAPVQGVRLRDGPWSAAGPNLLNVRATAAKSMEVRFLEKGPLKTVVQVRYRFDCPQYAYGDRVVREAGEGFYWSTIELQAGQPSILLEEETDLDFSYSLDFYGAVHPTHARYRGHHADSKQLGYEPDGRPYRASHARAEMDAQFDLWYDRDYPSSYRTSVGRSPAIRRMAIWDPWVFNGGWYWQMFDAQAPDAAPVVGIFAGRASRALGAHMSGPGFYTRAATGAAPPEAGITVSSKRRGADGRVFGRSRFHWGLFVGTKGQDLASPERVQPIARQMNLHGGFNLNKIHRYSPDFPDPPQGYGAMYMDKAAVANLIEKLRSDEAYFRWAYGAEPTSRELIDFWRNTSGRKADAPVKSVTAFAQDVLQQLIHGDGIYSFRYHYWHGGLEMSRKLVWIDQLLGSEQVSPQYKRRLKAAAVLFASVLYDNDFVPLDNGECFNLGTPNMPVQQQNYRTMYALFLARHPMMAKRVKGVAGAASRMLQQTVNEHGAHMGSLHYVGAANGPLLATFQQLQMAGVHDAFAGEERLAQFAEFYLQAISPPEVRFGAARKMVSIGDGATEGTEEYGMLATGFARSNPKLSARLMGAWREQGKVHTGFHGSTLLKINDDLPGVTPNLGDARFPGYYSVLRSGWGTPEENAIWCVNGNFYVDHCHNDLGSLVIYALGAPLSVDWGSFYTPRTAGGAMHSTVVQESAFGQAWDKDIAGFDNGEGFSAHYGNVGVGEATALEVFPEGRRMVSTIRTGSPRERTEWVRAVTLVNVDPAVPLILVRDTFRGKDATAPKILTLNLMAQGEVHTPAGTQTPPPRSHPAADHKTGDPKHQLPSAGPVFTLKPGVNRLGFTGQVWKGHPTQGIDWDVYQIAAEQQRAHVGHWAHVSSPGANEFRQAQGRPFEESQYILRVRGTGAFTTLIVPWMKGKKPKELTVTRVGEVIVVATAAGSTGLDPRGFSVTRGGTTTRRAFEE